MSFKKFLKESFFHRSFTCDACGIETFDNNLCPACLEKTVFNNKIFCPICGRKTFRREICIECKSNPPLFEGAVSPFVYEGTIVTLIHKFKNGEPYLKEYFADMIVGKFNELSPFDYITFVPMTKKAERKRGYNQAKLLAESISERVNIPVVDVVKKVKETPAQKTLSIRERAKNLENCFKQQNGLPLLDKNVLLVDDVLTTGATAEAISLKLFKTGATRVFLATIASVEYKPNKKPVT